MDDMVLAQKRGEGRGLPSVCSAHPWVLRAAMRRAGPPCSSEMGSPSWVSVPSRDAPAWATSSQAMRTADSVTACAARMASTSRSSFRRRSATPRSGSSSTAAAPHKP
ncbi:MAG: class II D-tagatose-bisphosphate aldolase, non-catalytic subunit, partial [Anaerolineales bacterium]|nr:class II D-tagatose-bisphosphate aldolase, non-catalytic subunit [Anaerolineales bacterium]